MENPANGLTGVRSDVVPVLRYSESGRFNPRSLRPLWEVAWREGNRRGYSCNSYFRARAPKGYVLLFFRVLRHSPGLSFRFFLFGSNPTLDMSTVRDWDKFHDWALQPLGAIEGMGSSGEMPDLLGYFALNLAVCFRAAPTPSRQDPVMHLDLALSPDLSCHPLAAAGGIDGKRQTRMWSQEQVGEGVRKPGWYHKDLVDKIGIISAQLFHPIGDCRLQLYLAPKMARETPELRSVASGRRIQANGLKMDSGHTGRRAFREVVSRNNGRARRRWLWGLAESETVGGGPIRTDSGGMMNEPYNDEIAPHVSRAALATHPPFPVLGANWNNSGDGK